MNEISSETKKAPEYRTPPHSKEAEDGILGALLIDNNTYGLIDDKIDAEDFYDYGNQIIFRYIKKLISEGRPADVLTVFDSLKEAGLQTETGGIEYLNRLADYTPGTANVVRYAEIVRDRSIRRRLISVGTEISTDSMNAGEKEARDLLDEAQSKVIGISDEFANSNNGFQKIDNVLASYANKLKELSELDTTSISGIATGFVDLDRMTTGLHEGELIIIAGRPAMGKTAFALNIASHVAVQQSLPVAIFSMEMTAEQLTGRLISARAQINQNELKTGHLSDWRGFYTASEELSKAPIYIDETSALTILNLRSRVRRLQNLLGGKLGLVVVDYLQLMSGVSSARGSDNRASEIAEISRGLKGLAKELKVPVIALSQLKREVDSRPDKRPLMSDLRESGSIEQDADLILFLYREGAYRKRGAEGEAEEMPDEPDVESADAQEAEVIIGKQRSGPTGTVHLLFQGPYTRFVNKATNAQMDSY